MDERSLDGRARTALLDAMRRYDVENPYYDETFAEVTQRIRAQGSAGKLDISALVFWKRIRAEGIARRLLGLREDDVRSATHAAFDPGLSDADRLAALDGLPGFRRRGAVASTLLAAWDPVDYAVFDTNAVAGLGALGINAERTDLTAYFRVVRHLRDQIRAGGEPVSARDIDKGLYMLTRWNN